MHTAGLACWNTECEDQFSSLSRQLDPERGENDVLKDFKEQKKKTISIQDRTYGLKWWFIAKSTNIL